MKRFLSIFVIFSLAFSLCACGAAPSDAEPVENAQIANPVNETTAEGLLAATGLILTAPEGATDVGYVYIDREGGTPVAQLHFTLDGVSCNYRAASAGIPGDKLEDISGMCYQWNSDAKAEVGTLTAELYWIEGEQGRIAWYDTVPGILYSLSVDSGASEAALTALAAAVFASVRGEVDGLGSAGWFQPLCVKDAGSLNADLDGDGADDTVLIDEWTVDAFGSGQYGFSVEGSSGLTVVFDELYVGSKPVLWLADVDGDALPEILFSGDSGSDDYYSACFKWDGSVLKRIHFDGYTDGFADGCVEAADNGVITLGAYCYVLGTYGGRRDFRLADGAIVPADDSIWSFNGNETWLTTSEELPAMLGGEYTTLPAGTELCLTGFDGVGVVYFATRDNAEGSLTVEKNDSFWGWLIGGVEETKCFEFLPYAG